MQYKINLHTHTNEDPQDFVNYSTYECLDTASSLGFGAIALTCHDRFINKSEYSDYAARKGILLIPGIEQTIEKRHIIILNCGEDIEKIKSFDRLREYKKSHPEIFIIAVHPCFPGNYSIKEKELILHREIFDAVEYSWFYTKHVNFSKRGMKLAKKLNLPCIATSDTRDLSIINVSYLLIDVREKTAASIFEAIRSGAFTNISAPQTFHKAAIFYTKGKFNTTLKRLGLKSAN